MEDKRCVKCGKIMTGPVMIRVNKGVCADGIYPWCIECAGERMGMIALACRNIRPAMYAMCASMDIPYLPMQLKKEKTAIRTLKAYIDTVRGRPEKQFAEGQTELAVQEKPKETEKEDARPAAQETLDKRNKSLKEMAKRWGAELSAEEYEELERKYDIEAHEFKGNLTPRVEKNLIMLSKLDVDLDRAIAGGDFDKANRITDIIRKTREMESLRASDEKPSEEMRVDALISALEARGAMEDGTLMDRETLLRAIGDARGHYDHSLDIIDAVMLCMENARRRTDGEIPLSSVPYYLQVQDEKGELVSNRMTDQEQEVMRGLNRIPPSRDVK